MKDIIWMKDREFEIDTEEHLHPIFFKEFFDTKYQTVNETEGIQGLGIITPTQSIHVLNSTLIDSLSGKHYPGRAPHDVTQRAVLSKIYGIDTLNTDINDRVISFLDEFYSLLDQFCQLHGLQKIETVGKTYMAAGGIRECEIDVDKMPRKEAIIETPAYINDFQCRQLCAICENIHQLHDPHIGGIIYGVDPRLNYEQKGFVIPNRTWDLMYGYGYNEGELDKEYEEIKNMLDKLESEKKLYRGFNEYTERSWANSTDSEGISL